MSMPYKKDNDRPSKVEFLNTLSVIEIIDRYAIMHHVRSCLVGILMSISLVPHVTVRCLKIFVFV